MEEKPTGIRLVLGMRLRDMPTRINGEKWLNWLLNRHSTWYARIRQHPAQNDRSILGHSVWLGRYQCVMYYDYTWWFLVTVIWSHPIYL